MVAPVTLKELIELSKDGEWGKEAPFDDSVEMAVIRGTDFERVRIGNTDELPSRHIPRRIADRKTLQANDILFETAGGSKDRPTGRSLLIKPGILERLKQAATCASFSRFIRIDPAKADPGYVFWYLQALYADGHLLKYHTQHTGVARFQYTVFAEREPLELPPFETQRRVAEILSAYDDLIENNTRRIAILEEMARSLYREWFVNFRFPGHEDVEIGGEGVPCGWTAGTLAKIAREKRISVDPTAMDPATPYVGLEHIPRRSLALGDWGSAEQVQSTKLRFEAGDILFGKIRPYFHKVAVAPVDGVASSDAIVIVPLDETLHSLTVLTVFRDDFVAEATQTSQGTKMPRANWDVLLKYPVSIPSKEVLVQFNRTTEPSLNLIRTLVMKNRVLRQARDLVLPKLISGELSVEVAQEEMVAAGS